MITHFLNTHTIAEYCRLSYEPAGIPGALLDRATAFRHGPRVFVLAGTPLRVVFRGTNDGEGWLADLDTHKANGIHEGFDLYWRALRHPLKACIGTRR